MPGFGGFYKGEKRKKKKNREKSSSSIGLNAPTFKLPEIIRRKKGVY